jgi:glycosyltransferase involved in cell wall biosynthesis
MAGHVLLPYVRDFEPDIILSFFLYPDGYAALKIGKAISVPVVAVSLGSDINRIGDPISALHTRTVLREADFVVTVSDDLRRKAVAMGARTGKVRAITNGCDLSVFHVRDRLWPRQKLGIDPKSKAVVYIGRLDQRKGLCELVEAATVLRPQWPELHVYMVGEGPDRTLIQSVIEANNAAGFVHALPGCSFDEVATWMAAADVVTLPSYMEGCPNVILEALACGRPVVATNVGGIHEIMNDECGQLVPPGDPGALAKALESVLNRTWDSVAISAQWGRSWDAKSAELLEIFESLIQAQVVALQAR